MKKLLFLAPMLAAILGAASGCSTENNPKDIADSFMQAFLVDMDTDEARKYVSEELKDEFPETGSMNELELHFVKILKDHTVSHRYAFAYDKSRSEIEGDSADIHYVVTAAGNPAFAGEASVELEKGADGKWQVADYSVARDESAIDFGF